MWRQGKHVIVELELKLLIINNQIEFRKTLETGVDLYPVQVSVCWIQPVSAFERLHMIVEGERFYYKLLKHS